MLILFKFSFCRDVQVECTSTAGDGEDNEWDNEWDKEWNDEWDDEGDDDWDGDGDGDGDDDDWDGDGDNGCIWIVTLYIIQL